MLVTRCILLTLLSTVCSVHGRRSSKTPASHEKPDQSRRINDQAISKEKEPVYYETEQDYPEIAAKDYQEVELPHCKGRHNANPTPKPAATTTTTKPKPITTTTTPKPTTTTTTPRSTTTTTTTTTTSKPTTTTTTTPKPTTTTTTPRPTTTTTTTTTTPKPTTTTTTTTTTPKPISTTTTPQTTTTTTTLPPTTTTTTTTTTPQPTTITTTPALPPPSVEPCLKRTKADIIFLLDASTSIGQTNWKKQVKFASDVTEGFNVGLDDVRFGTVIFNSKPLKIFDLNIHFNHSSLSQALLDINYPFQSGTKTYKGLQFITDDKMFSPSAGGRPDANDIVIVMTDGKSDNSTMTLEAAKNLKNQGITIISVGIGDALSKEELVAIASSPSYVFEAIGFSLLDYIKRDLVKLTCDSI